MKLGKFLDVFLGFFFEILDFLFNDIFYDLNEFLKQSFDSLLYYIPSTPDSFKLGALVSGYTTANSFQEYFVIQIFQGIFGILGLIVIYKSLKLLPFI